MNVKVTDHLHDPPTEIDLDIADVESVGVDLDHWPPFIVIKTTGRFRVGPEDAMAVAHAMVDLAIERRGTE